MKILCYLLILFNAIPPSSDAQEFKSLNIWSGDHNKAHSLFGVNACHIKNQDDHAPGGLRSFHNHPRKKMMFSYKFMVMNMGEVYERDRSVLMSEVFERFSYRVIPFQMQTLMFMAVYMYSISDRFGISVMGQWLSKRMHLSMRSGNTFSTVSKGLGDLKIGGLYEILRKKQKKIFVGGTISIPTGSIDRRDDTPMMDQSKLPYSMQIGSGTFGITGVVVFSGELTNYNYGIQQVFTKEMGRNKSNYKIGNTLESNAWLTYMASDRLSFSTRFNFKSTNNIIGSDPDLNAMMVLTADPRNTGGKVFSGSLGINYFPLLDQNSKGLKLAIEYNYPIYQNWNLLHMSTNSVILAGISKAF